MRYISLAALGTAMLFCLSHTSAQEKKADFVTNFPLEKGELTSTGRNAFFILEPGFTLILEDEKVKVVVTVLNQTKKFGDIETRVIEERATKDGKISEVARGYFAISKKTKNVYYFGEDVDEYEDGKIVGHQGSWLHGVKGAKFGLIMPGTIVIGARYAQEQAPDVAMDRAENISVKETVITPAGLFKNCLKVEETTPLNAEHKEYKFYAPNIGLVQDGTLKLTKHGFVKLK